MRLFNRKQIVSVCSLLLAVVLMAICTGDYASMSVKADQTAADIQQEINNLNKEQKDIEKRLEALKKDIANKQEIQAALEQQIENAKEQIDAYNLQIPLLNEQVATAQKEYDAVAGEFESKLSEFKARIRAMYMTGNTSYLAMLLSADDFSDYLYKSELVKVVSAKDTALLDSIKKEYNKIAKIQQNLKKKQKSLEGAKTALAEKQASLHAQYDELEALIGDLKDQHTALVEDSKEALADKEKLEKELAELSKTDNGLVYNGDDFMWPVPGYYKLSSKYRPPHRPRHAGIDISSSGIYGKPIIAAASGTITTAGDNGNGYGIYVVIDHGKDSNGKKYTTLYGHCSSILVKKGQYVEAGQVIGYVGSTGQSTGPHLHFEIRINNTPTNPMNYFS